MNGMKTTLLLGLMTGVLLAMGQMMGGGPGVMIFGVIAIAMNFGAYWYSDRVVLSMYKAVEVGSGHPLHDVVTELTQGARMPMPKVYVIPEAAPNAFATGRNPSHAAVAATEGILQMLSRQELRGVMAHELAHVQNRDTLISTIAASMAAIIAMLANMLRWGLLFGMGGRDDEEGGDNVLAALVMIIAAPLIAGLIQMAISRSREFGADEGGARISGDPLSLARALQKLEMAARQVPLRAGAATAQATSHLFIVNPLCGSNMAKLFSSHPPTQDRIVRLEQLAGVRPR